VVTDSSRGPALARAVADRTGEIVGALRGLDECGLRGPTALDDWSRLTVACHLRHGAKALSRMALDVRAGRPTSYYPAGREHERPATLVPAPGETPCDVVESLVAHSEELQRVWESLGASDWELTVREPDDNPDLGPLSLVRLPLMRLTEVEVHGTDLGLGLNEWSKLFVDTALPFRLEWLNVRRSNGREVDNGVQASWLLVATDGPAYLVTVAGRETYAVTADVNASASAVIEGTSRDLLALLLGRPTAAPLKITGDHVVATSFSKAFPGP
jgi:maleylpyruvate isomerase